METIQKLKEKQQEAAQELTVKLGLLSFVVKELTDSVGMREEVAVRTTLDYVKDQIIDLFQGPNGEISGMSLSNMAAQVVCHMNTMIQDLASSTIAFGTTTVSLGQITKDTSVALSEAASKLVQVTAEELLGGLGELMKSAGRTLITSAAAENMTMNVLKGIGIAAGLTFTVIDVSLLILNWNNPHPLVLSIQNIVQDLVQDVGRCEESLSALRRLWETDPKAASLPKVSI